MEDTLHRREQCLERRETTPSHRVRAAGLAAEAHRKGNRRSPGDRWNVPEGCGRGGQTAGRVGSGVRRQNRPTRRPPTPCRFQKPANEVSPDSDPIPVPGRSPTASVCEPHFDFIELSLSKGRNAKAIYQDLVDDQRLHRPLPERQTLRPPVAGAALAAKPARSSSLRPAKRPRSITAAAPWSVTRTRAATAATRMFVLTLGYSRKAVCLLTFQSSTRIWAELHEQAFRRLGGGTRTVVLDNLGEGVLKPDIYDPALNPL